MDFTCIRCGTCCHEYEFADETSLKRIPVFVDELENLEHFATVQDIKIKFLEDVVFPDTKNEKIIVITYKIILEGEERCCPFFSADIGCQVNSFKPLACKAYPIAQKKVDAYHISIDLDPYCKYVENHDAEIRDFSEYEIETSFPAEFRESKRLMEKNQQIILKIKQLTYQGKIIIPETVNPEELDAWLQTWDREYLDDL
ncbi:MAG TPA: YkgJ family cysteine cluster protein [Candidatus Lokiarchaeia archaeon]|nr:YkgJ family cysteine cluster protein [Candidatus Lokiarchaeia archaeon]